MVDSFQMLYTLYISNILFILLHVEAVFPVVITLHNYLVTSL